MSHTRLDMAVAGGVRNVSYQVGCGWGGWGAASRTFYLVRIWKLTSARLLCILTAAPPVSCGRRWNCGRMRMRSKTREMRWRAGESLVAQHSVVGGECGAADLWRRRPQDVRRLLPRPALREVMPPRSRQRALLPIQVEFGCGG